MALVLLPLAAQATPYIPANDAVVLEQLPQPQGKQQIRLLQRTYDANPRDRDAAFALIDGYMALGRHEGDPRYYGYAEAVTNALRAMPEANPNDVRLLLAEANIRQRRHDFDGALVRLNKVIRAEPGNAQAHTMRAVIAMVRGEYDAAMEDCRAVLSPANGALLGFTCVAMVEGLTGKLVPAYTRLSALYSRVKDGETNDDRGWALSALAEMATRLGDVAAAEGYWREALAVNANDYYALAAFADLLIATQRAEEAVALLAPYRNQDSLLLRLCLGEAARGGSNLEAYAAQMRERIIASEERKEAVHLRDYAVFMLTIEQQPHTAFAMATENWKTQKEPADARILIESALAVGDRAAARAVRAWQRAHFYQDVTFERYGDVE